MHKLVTYFLTLGFVLTVLFTQPSNSAAQVGDAWQLIAEVNALRAAYGLSPYEVNNALMSAAQNQSDHQASIGSWTHTGPGGSRPYDRAVAAGYGDGARVFVSENVAMGIDLGTSRTVNEMWQDATHLETMISPLYTHIGAGVGRADGRVYYTIVVGYIAGSAGSRLCSRNTNFVQRDRNRCYTPANRGAPRANSHCSTSWRWVNPTRRGVGAIPRKHRGCL